MADPRIQKLAELVVKYSTKIKDGDKVVINAPAAAQPLTRAIYLEVIKAGGFPIVLPRGDFEDILYKLRHRRTAPVRSPAAALHRRGI